tara:strand:- start:235 stop:1158 length:924 start_codon:yes stop_codon:yes gene_type:complete
MALPALSGLNMAALGARPPRPQNDQLRFALYTIGSKLPQDVHGKPHRLRQLNHDKVLGKDGSTAWEALDDLCPWPSVFKEILEDVSTLKHLTHRQPGVLLALQGSVVVGAFAVSFPTREEFEEYVRLVSPRSADRVLESKVRTYKSDSMFPTLYVSFACTLGAAEAPPGTEVRGVGRKMLAWLRDYFENVLITPMVQEVAASRGLSEADARKELKSICFIDLRAISSAVPAWERLGLVKLPNWPRPLLQAVKEDSQDLWRMLSNAVRSGDRGQLYQDLRSLFGPRYKSHGGGPMAMPMFPTSDDESK